MGCTWTKESRPRWDADKQAAFDTVALASVGMKAPTSDTAIADEWWRVADDVGNLIGYGWLDSGWGDAQIAFFVTPRARGNGAGGVILNRLRAGAAARGLDYIFNLLPAGHPHPPWEDLLLTQPGLLPF